jgi:hypothetical protein
LKIKTNLLILFFAILVARLLYPAAEICLYILTHTREEVVNYSLQLLGKQYLYPYISEIYTPQKHGFAKIVACVFWVFIFGILVAAIFLRERIYRTLRYLLEGCSRVIADFFGETFRNSGKNTLLLSGIFMTGLAVCLISIFTVPTSFDEADTWLLFISKGPLFISSFYPFPNNHIFYNWMVWLISFLPVSPSILLRIPLIPAFVITFFVFYRYVKSIFDEKTGLISSAVLIFTYSFLEYNHLGRGYLFLLMFSIILLYALHNINSGFRKRYQYAILASLILGTYSVPSFIYFLMPVLLFYLLFYYKKDSDKAWLLFKISFIAVFVIFILYTPILLVSGNYNFMRQYEPIAVSRIPEVLIKIHHQLFKYIFGYTPLRFAISLLFLAGIITGLFDEKRRWLLILTFALIITPYLVFILQRQVYPPRIFIHLILLTSMFIGSLFFYINNQRIVIAFFFILISFYIYHNNIRNPIFAKYDKMDKAAELISEKIIGENKKSIFFSQQYPKPLIEFYTKIDNHKITIFNENGKWKQDSFNSKKNYDVIFWKSGDSRIIQMENAYDIFYSDETLTITTRKD